MNNADEVVVGANGQIYVGATGQAEPTDATTALVGTYSQLGFVSEDGVSFTDSKTVEAIGAWQSFYAIRRIITGRELTVSFQLRQWNDATVPFALGGGTVTEPSPGEYTYTPPAPETIDERSLILDWQDGDKNYRLWIPRGMVTENVETNLTRTAAADLPITFAAISDGADDAYILFTDDPAFEAGSGS